MSAAGARGPLPVPTLMMVTDPALTSAAGALDVAGMSRLVAAVARAARAGVDLVQVRQPFLEGSDLLALTRNIVTATAASRMRTVVNDRADVAIAASAHGVHLPERGAPAARVRATVPDGFLIGRSVHSVAAAVEAEQHGGSDYLVFGSVFESTSKPAGHTAAGVKALHAVCEAVRLPVIAIGGITTQRIADVARAGAAGFAAIGLFMETGDEQLAGIVETARAAFARE